MADKDLSQFPLGTTDFDVFMKNVENEDKFVNSEEHHFEDRKHKNRYTLAGLENLVETVAVDGEERITQAIINSGYQQLGDYAAGIELTEYNQIFRYQGEWWRAAATTELPYTTTGDWGTEGDFFVGVGDVVLRQELGDRVDLSKGVNLVPTASRVVANIETLRALPLDGNPWVIVNGYYESGDGGGGFYYLDIDDSDAVDNGGTVIVADDGGVWKLNHNGSVWVKQFGARGEGSGDDHPYIQNALSSGIKDIKINPSYQSYPISQPLFFRGKSVRISGVSRDLAVIVKTSESTSGLAPVKRPGGVEEDVYDVNAGLILIPDDDDYSEDIILDSISIRGFEKTGIGLYAPRLCLSQINNVAIWNFDLSIYVADIWMVSMNRTTSRGSKAGFVLGDFDAPGGNGTSLTLTSCWVADIAIGRVAYDITSGYSNFLSCGADFMGFDGDDSGPVLAIWRFRNSNATNVLGFTTESARGPIAIADNGSNVFFEGLSTFRYYGDWEAELKYAFISQGLSSLVINGLSSDVDHISPLTIKWGLCRNESNLEVRAPKNIYPRLIDQYGPNVVSESGSTFIVKEGNKEEWVSSLPVGDKGNTLIVDGNIGTGFGTGTWNTGHLRLGIFHIWVHDGQLYMKDSAPTSGADGAKIGP